MDIYEADYFAAVSLYMNAKVAVNLGQCPFKHLNGILQNDIPSSAEPKQKSKKLALSPLVPSEKSKKYSDQIQSYWNLCNPTCMQKFGIFKIKTEKLEDYWIFFL